MELPPASGILLIRLYRPAANSVSWTCRQLAKSGIEKSQFRYGPIIFQWPRGSTTQNRAGVARWPVRHLVCSVP